MSLRYLLGPTPPGRAERWQSQRRQGHCLCFDATGSADVTIQPGDWAFVQLDLQPGQEARWQTEYALARMARLPSVSRAVRQQF